jgi:hypothetical protein
MTTATTDLSWLTTTRTTTHMRALEQLSADIVINAIEGGFTSMWGSVTNYKWRDADWESNSPPTTRATIKSEDYPMPIHIHSKDVLTYMLELVEGKHKDILPTNIALQLVGAVILEGTVDDVACTLDAYDCDSIIQAVALGEVVYG